MVAVEFQAIVLAAGRGTRLPELTSDHPKCLLPLGPYPILWYPLQMLQQHNFQDVIVVVLESQKSEIQQALEKTPLKLKLDYATIPSDSDFGTADSLRHIHDKIKSDFIVVSSDVVTSASLYPLINKFRQHNASVAALLFSGGIESGVTVPGPKSKHKPERDLVGIHPETNRLLFLASTSDFDEELIMSGHLLRKNEKMHIYSRLVDSHIYVMKKWVIDFLTKKENFSTLKGEFLPYIVKKQMCRSTHPAHVEATSEVGLNIKAEDDIFNYVPYTNLEHQITTASLYNESRNKEPYSGDIIRCYAIRAPKDSTGFRVNTTISYFAANQKISSIWPKLFENIPYSLVSPNAVVNSTQVKDIAVADNAKLSEKTSLSLSTFGPHCTVNPKNIITSSVVMGHATIEEGCNIEYSIICNRAVIKKGSHLKNCLIGPNFVVEEGSKKQMVHLTNADGFMEIE